MYIQADEEYCACVKRKTGFIFKCGVCSFQFRVMEESGGIGGDFVGEPNDSPGAPVKEDDIRFSIDLSFYRTSKGSLDDQQMAKGSSTICT